MCTLFHLLQVKLASLREYLLSMRGQGYSLVGVEQTAQSKCITKYQFQRRTVLVLGYVCMFCYICAAISIETCKLVFDRETWAVQEFASLLKFRLFVSSFTEAAPNATWVYTVHCINASIPNVQSTTTASDTWLSWYLVVDQMLGCSRRSSLLYSSTVKKISWIERNYKNLTPWKFFTWIIFNIKISQSMVLCIVVTAVNHFHKNVCLCTVHNVCDELMELLCAS